MEVLRNSWFCICKSHDGHQRSDFPGSGNHSFGGKSQEDGCSMDIHGDITEVLLVTWNFPAWKKVETEMSQL